MPVPAHRYPPCPSLHSMPATGCQVLSPASASIPTVTVSTGMCPLAVVTIVPGATPGIAPRSPCGALGGNGDVVERGGDFLGERLQLDPCGAALTSEREQEPGERIRLHGNLTRCIGDL